MILKYIIEENEILVKEFLKKKDYQEILEKKLELMISFILTV